MCVQHHSEHGEVRRQLLRVSSGSNLGLQASLQASLPTGHISPPRPPWHFKSPSHPAQSKCLISFYNFEVLLFTFNYYIPVCICHVYGGAYGSQKRVTESPETGVTGSCELPCRCAWKQQALLITNHLSSPLFPFSLMEAVTNV